MTTCGLCGTKGNHKIMNRCKVCDLEERRVKRQNNHSSEVKRVREWEMFTWYGISLDMREQMAADQDSRCLLCHTPEDKSAFGLGRLQVEHCHCCAEVRGLVCQKCNGRIQRHEKGQRVPVEMIDQLDDYIDSKCQLECRVRIDVAVRARDREIMGVIA